MLNLHRLRLLHELAQRGTLAAVAEALGYSPSTVSQQLSILEREAGAELLAPEGRRVRLTAHGVALAAAGAELLALEERTRVGLEVAQERLAPVRVAVFQTAAHAILPGALAALAASAPQLRVEVAVVPPEEGLAEVAARSFDLALAEQYPGRSRPLDAGLRRELLGLDPIRLALPPGDPARGIADVADRAWVMEPAGTAARDWSEQQCRAAGFEPDVRFVAEDLTAHARLIASGLAVGILPGFALAGAEREVDAVDLPGSPHREIFTAVRAATGERPALVALRGALAESFAAV